MHWYVANIQLNTHANASHLENQAITNDLIINVNFVTSIEVDKTKPFRKIRGRDYDVNK